MPHNYIPLNLGLIPLKTQKNIPTFKLGCFSNDGERYLIPGYIIGGSLAHSNSVLLSWLQWEDDPQATLDLLIKEAVPYVMTIDELKANRLDVNSIWYTPAEGER